ncbi:MAG: hypothetical protein ABUS51_07460 [Acidobacteriota bacterium]
MLLGILDSSFLMLPLGNDLLVVALTANRPAHIFYYVGMAAVGSTIGVALAHWVSLRTGQKAMEGSRKGRQIAFVKRKVEKYGGFAIAVATLAPPGFPFTPFIVVSAALQYPRTRMLLIVGSCRVLRFLVAGWLALIYGRRLIEMAKSPGLQHFVAALVIVSVIGSVFSIWGWVRQGRRRAR